MKEQPCKRDCPERKAGCGTTCERWQAYVKKRNADYEKRRKQREFDEVCFEGKIKNLHRSFTKRRK